MTRIFIGIPCTGHIHARLAFFLFSEGIRAHVRDAHGLKRGRCKTRNELPYERVPTSENEKRMKW